MSESRLGWREPAERAETIEAANAWEKRALAAEAALSEAQRIMEVLQEDICVLRGDRCAEEYYGVGDGPCGKCVKCLQQQLSETRAQLQKLASAKQSMEREFQAQMLQNREQRACPSCGYISEPKEA